MFGDLKAVGWEIQVSQDEPGGRGQQRRAWRPGGMQVVEGIDCHART